MTEASTRLHLFVLSSDLEMFHSDSYTHFVSNVEVLHPVVGISDSSVLAGFGYIIIVIAGAMSVCIKSRYPSNFKEEGKNQQGNH